MPITPPAVDNRRYQQLVDDVLARARVHTPEWTNFSQSDPGVTLVQLFAFLTESLLYRANLVPVRNRARFLQLLGVPLAPAAAARGIVTFTNERGPAQTLTLPADLEVRAGPILFRTGTGLDVLPVETRVYYKAPLADPSPELIEYYRLLYASYGLELPAEPSLYRTVAFDPAVVDRVDLGGGTVDQSLWIALLGRPGDRNETGPDPWSNIRDQLGGRTLALGVMPALDGTRLLRRPGAEGSAGDRLVFEMPGVGTDRRLPLVGNRPAPGYRQLAPRTAVDLLTSPGVVELPLPSADQIGTWEGLQPLEAGVGDLPPALEDTALADRVITWLRIRARIGADARLLWVGVNAATVRQHERVIAEPFADGDGTADQVRRLARPPVLAGSIEVVTEAGGVRRSWHEIDDLMAAGPEVPVADDRLPPGTPAPPTAPADVFAADHEAGVLTFGDGFRGRRLPFGARVFASYEFCQGAAGNVPAGAINSAPTLPSGLSVTNPLRTWGGADAEPVADGEKQVRRYLQHRDRLVSREDFLSIAWRTPGVDIGRIEVLPAFHPDLMPNEPGLAPGVVTVMAIPRVDPGQPDAPRADRLFLDAICRHLDPRRLVTTELIVTGPVYRPLWISVGIDVASGYAIAEVTQAVTRRLRQVLAPVPPPPAQIGFAAGTGPLFGPPPPAAAGGWPLRTPVGARVLLAEVARVPGVLAVDAVLLAEDRGGPTDEVPMAGLELPRVVGLSVVAGEAVPIEALRGDAQAPAGGVGGEPPAVVLPIPVLAESC